MKYTTADDCAKAMEKIDKKVGPVTTVWGHIKAVKIIWAEGNKP